MKPRDRLVACVLVAVAGLAAIWLGVVSPKRDDAAQLGSRLGVAQARLSAAQSQLAGARAAEADYAANLHVVKALYKAVPATADVPRLLVTLDRTSHYKRVDFKVVTVASAAPTAGAAAAAAPIPGGLTPTSFTFTFHGGYIELQHFLGSIARYTLLNGSKVVAHGRLLTIQSVALTQPQGTTATTQAAVTATAYSQPAAGAAAPSVATSTASAPAATPPATVRASAPAATPPATAPAATVAPSTNPTR